MSILAAIGSCISFLSQLTGVHGWYSGLKTGKEVEKTVRYLETINVKVERISDRILHAPALLHAQPVDRSAPAALTRKQLYELFDPLQRTLREEVLCAAIFETPGRLRDILARDPWKVLIEIRPLAYAARPVNPDLVPVVFADESAQFVGWQTVGALPLLLGINYSQEGILQLGPRPRIGTSGPSNATLFMPGSSLTDWKLQYEVTTQRPCSRCAQPVTVPADAAPPVITCNRCVRR